MHGPAIEQLAPRAGLEALVVSPRYWKLASSVTARGPGIDALSKSAEDGARTFHSQNEHLYSGLDLEVEAPNLSNPK